jgi:hypothetical protein
MYLSNYFNCTPANISVHHVGLTLFQELANYSQYPDDPVVETDSKYHGVGFDVRS